MVLTVDVGNSNISVGAFEGKKAVFTARMRTDRLRTEDEYAVLLRDIFRMHGFDASAISGAALSCVVPSLAPVIVRAIGILSDVSVVAVGPGVKTGINLRIDDPASCGADLVCTAAGAAEKYPLPAIIVNLGTATKITVVDEKRCFRGGMLAPGVELSLGALARTAALLPGVDLARAFPTIPTNTTDSIVCGSVLGTAAMIDGVVARYREALGEVKTVVATGRLASVIIPHCRSEIAVDPELLLNGLLAIYRRNS